jgi:hypothetical protein
VKWEVQRGGGSSNQPCGGARRPCASEQDGPAPPPNRGCPCTRVRGSPIFSGSAGAAKSTGLEAHPARTVRRPAPFSPCGGREQAARDHMEDVTFVPVDARRELSLLLARSLRGAIALNSPSARRGRAQRSSRGNKSPILRPTSSAGPLACHLQKVSFGRPGASRVLRLDSVVHAGCWLSSIALSPGPMRTGPRRCCTTKNAPPVRATHMSAPRR